MAAAGTNLLDAECRELERAVRESPHDRTLSRRYLQALDRAGLVAPPAPDGVLEAAANPGLAVGALVLVARRARPRETFVWLPEMDASLGEVARIERLSRDGLTAVLEGERAKPARFPGDPRVGRTFGFASLIALGG